MKPASVAIGTPYGARGSMWSGGVHKGVDLLTPVGTEVVAPWSGTVVEAGRTSWGSAFGTAVIIDFDHLPDGSPGLWGILAHLSSTSVRPGARVAVGGRVGRSGATGNVSGPHLHFEVQRDRRWRSDNHVNPQPWLDAQKGTTMADQYGLDDPNRSLTVGRSYVRFSTNWNPSRDGLQFAKRYSKGKPVFYDGKSGGALRFKCVRTNPEDPTFYHDEGVTVDMLDDDGFFLRSFSSFESGDDRRDLYWMVKCVGGMKSCVIEETRYAGFAVQD